MDIKKICLKISCVIIMIVIILSSYALYLPCGNTSIQEEQSQAQPQNIQIEEPIVEEKNIENVENKIEEQEDVKIEEVKNPIAAEESVTVASTEEKTKVTSRGGSSIREEEKTENKKISLGVYKLTAYCGCSKCCGKSTGITASGAKAKANHTIAAPKNFAFGTKIEIDDNIYVVEDRGGAIKGNKIDVYFSSHSEALSFGVKYKEIYRVD